MDVSTLLDIDFTRTRWNEPVNLIKNFTFEADHQIGSFNVVMSESSITYFRRKIKVRSRTERQIHKTIGLKMPVEEYEKIHWIIGSFEPWEKQFNGYRIVYEFIVNDIGDEELERVLKLTQIKENGEKTSVSLTEGDWFRIRRYNAHITKLFELFKDRADIQECVESKFDRIKDAMEIWKRQYYGR